MFQCFCHLQYERLITLTPAPPFSLFQAILRISIFPWGILRQGFRAMTHPQAALPRCSEQLKEVRERPFSCFSEGTVLWNFKTLHVLFINPGEEWADPSTTRLGENSRLLDWEPSTLNIHCVKAEISCSPGYSPQLCRNSADRADKRDGRLAWEFWSTKWL